jgi:hypothetical protein
MKILNTAPAIRSHIRDVLSDAGNDRHALVAFVGPNPAKFVKHLAGLNVYCWPLAGATNPAGVELLRRKGAKVTFVEGLHAKVYHSGRGTVIGSANLSSNALEGKLLETAIWLPPDAFSWKNQMAEVRKRTVFEADTPAFEERLQKLWREHAAFNQRNPRGARRSSFDAGDVVETDATKVSTFGEWFATPGRQQWQLHGFVPVETDPVDTLEAAIEEVGVRPEEYIGTRRRGALEPGVATLAFRYTATDGATKNSYYWWFPERMKKTKMPEWADNPFIWMATHAIPNGCACPFNEKEPRFQYALDKTVRKMKEMGYEIEDMQGPVNRRFLETVIDIYANAPEQ